MPKPGRTKAVSAAPVRAYAAKAEEFAEAAASDLADDRNIAATSLAIHAGINSAVNDEGLYRHRASVRSLMNRSGLRRTGS